MLISEGQGRMKETFSQTSSGGEPELPFGAGSSVPKQEDQDPDVVVIKGPPRPTGYPTYQTSTSSSKTQPEEPPMNPSTPSALNVKRSIDRQRKEQRAVSSILSGVGLALLLIIVGCATLSCFGGYVLWKQIQRQSVTVDQMEQRINKELASLQARDAELASGLESAGAQLAKQQSLLEQAKSQLSRQEKDISVLRQRLSNLEGDSGERRR
ncbi:MAG: hypothetical protein EBS59_01720 [Verrucomicrobia bacterium]|jgi:uncharacterized protein HemX|nr:hypothetical protein [Verrucomicrobiota bacterium]NBS83412.1 hypothetical protein [Verrucomicrobiota bacterium]